MLKKNLDLKKINLGDNSQFCVIPLSSRVKEMKNRRGYNNKIKINKKEKKTENVINYENIENDDLTLFYEGQKMEFEDINDEIDDFMDIIEEKQKEENLIDKINPLIKEKIKEEQKTKKSGNKKQKKKFTHFLNIPILNIKSFNKKFYAFENLITKIDPKLSKLIYKKHPHITLAVLSLTPDQENLVASIIFEIQNNIKNIINSEISSKKKKCHKFQINSLGFFAKGNNLLRTNVVFGEINDNNFVRKLNKMNNYILKNLSEMGIIDINDIPHVFYDELEGIYKVENFHVTFVKGKNGGFDGREVLRRYGDFNFGFFEFDKISLNRLDEEHTESISLSLV